MFYWLKVVKEALRFDVMFRWYYLASGFFLLLAMGAFNIVDRLVYGEWVASLAARSLWA